MLARLHVLHTKIPFYVTWKHKPMVGWAKTVCFRYDQGRYDQGNHAERTVKVHGACDSRQTKHIQLCTKPYIAVGGHDTAGSLPVGLARLICVMLPSD